MPGLFVVLVALIVVLVIRDDSPCSLCSGCSCISVWVLGKCDFGRWCFCLGADLGVAGAVS